MSAHYHLAVPNQPQGVAVAEAFVHRVGAALGLHPDALAKISKAAALATEYAVLFAYPDGRADQVSLDAWLEAGAMHVVVHDDGVPALPGVTEDPDRDAFEQKMTDAFSGLDSSEWSLLGYRGKQVELAIALPSEPQEAEFERPLPRLCQPVEPDQYVIRLLEPKDAIQVARLVYRTYGHTYDDEDYYFPDRIVAENETKAMVSIVAVHPAGEVVGHYALEQRDPPTIYEGSSAVVNPEHRGKGLMEKMRAFAMDEGRRLGLDGVYFLPWTIHTISQHANETFHAKLCAANLSDTSPVSIKGFESESMAQRVSTLLYFAPLRDLEPVDVYLPDRHREMLLEIYGILGRQVTPKSPQPPRSPQSTYTVRHLPHDRFAEIVFEEIGANAEHILTHEAREQTLRHGCETVYLDLPLSQAATPNLSEHARTLGFSFLGIGPCFAHRGDTLRLALMTEQLDPAHIHVLSPFGQRLVAYCLDDARSVAD